MSITAMERTAANRTGGELADQRGAETLGDLLERKKASMAAVLPKHLNPDRLIKIALVAVSRSKKLMEATPYSVLQSVMTAAQLGLDCGGALGSAYLVPFNRNQKDEGGRWLKTVECQLIIGYRGMIDLARRSGQISSIEARVVWENDKFDIKYGMETTFTHIPTLEGDPGKLRLVYGVAKLKDGGTQFELMTRAQIDAVRSRSKSKDDGPWVTDYPEMARKTVVKRLFKYLPVSVEMAEAVEQDNRSDFGNEMGFIEDAAAKSRSAAGMNSKLIEQAGGSAGAADPFGEPVEIPPEVSEEEANRIIEEKAAQTRAAEAAKSQPTKVTPEAPAAPTAPSDAIDPRDEYGEWLQQMHQVAAEVGMDGKDLDARLKREVMLKKGLVGKEWELPKSERAALAEVLKERRGIFA
jgi:recombination protein RecT